MGASMVGRAGLLAGLLTMVVLAGCAEDDEGDEGTGGDVPETFDTVGYRPIGFDAKGYAIPLLMCQPMLDGAETLHESAERCNFNMTPDEARQGNEVTIAVNPPDPRNIVGGAKDYYPTDAGDCVWDGVYVTHDGFNTTTQDRSFDGSPWRLLAEPDTFQPNYASQFWCTTDPVAYFDVNGILYYLLMAYQADRVTGSKTCEDICPNGALNDWAFNRAVQIVAKSTDGGDTFDTFTPVLEGSFPVDFHDKGWVAASRSGVIHVMWLAVLGPGNMYFRSLDGGETFPLTEMEVMAPVGQGSGQGSFIDVGTNYEVYATWSSGGIHLRRSNDDGATWDEDRVVLEPNGAGMPGLSPRDRRGGFPAFATDRNPFSPYADALYYVWQDSCQGEWNATCEGRQGSAIYFSSSFDKGETFSPPVRVSTPHSKDETNYEIFPVIGVSPGGVLDVSWMDTEGAGNFTCDAQCDDGQYPGFQQHYSYSLDGGRTWSDEVDVRDAREPGWDPKLSHHQNGMIFIGDYNDIDSSWQAAHPVWPDTRDGQYVKVYTATVLRPMFAEGWTPENMVDAIEFIREHPLR
jgi:hypothetical protein